MQAGANMLILMSHLLIAKLNYIAHILDLTCCHDQQLPEGMMVYVVNGHDIVIFIVKHIEK